MARALVDVLETTAVITRLLIFGVPLLVAVVALTTWFAVGRALAPVEAIRREVDEISAAQLHRRVPQPKCRRRDRPTGRDHEPHAGAARRRTKQPAPLRIRRVARVALAHHHHPPARRGRARPPRPNDAQELADVVLAEQHRMQRLVEDLLLLARADERVPLSRAPVDLDDLVFEEGQRLRSTTSKRVDTSGVGAARVRGDADALRRVFRNLGENAARHAVEPGRHRSRRSGDDVVLTVDDDGPGIPESERERVLQRFVRLDEARSRDDGGSGLGLSIVDEVVRAHGGSMSITQSPLGGARIQVTLPADEG